MIKSGELKANSVTQDPDDGRFYIFIDKIITDSNNNSRRFRKRKKLPAGVTEAQAHEALHRLLYSTTQRFSEKDCSSWDKDVQKMMDDSQSWAHQTLNKIKYRDRKAGRNCQLKITDIEFLLRSSNGRCAVTGIPFDFSKSFESKRAPYQPSVDRIDNSKGYSIDNIRLVCLAVNIAMADWGEEVFSSICSGYVFKRYDLTVRQP